MSVGKLIVKADLEDLTTIVDFQIKMALETENETLDEDILTKGCSKILKGEVNGHYLLAKAENSTTIACMLVQKEWSEWRNGDVLWVHSVYVLPKYRSQGIFKKLYSHLKDEINQNNELKGIRLYVDRRNKSAQEVYKKMGMCDQHYTMYEWLYQS